MFPGTGELLAALMGCGEAEGTCTPSLSQQEA